MALVPLPNIPSTNDPNRLVNSMLLVRVGLILLYAMFAALGGYRLYFFNTQKVKAQFRGQQALTERGQAGLPGIPVVRFGADQRARPLSITIIGWYLIIASALAPLSVAFTETLFFRSKLQTCRTPSSGLPPEERRRETKRRHKTLPTALGRNDVTGNILLFTYLYLL
jgi:hypothetical protein